MKLRKVTKWYHATDIASATQILADGYIKPNKDQMIFLATSKEDAGFFLNARGHDKYVIFEIHRRDIDQKRLLQNPATPNMLSGVYVKPIAVTNKHLKLVQDDRDLTYGIDGLKLISEGNGKTSYSIDTAAWDKHLINKIGADAVKQFNNLMDAGKQAEAEKFLEQAFIAA
tara:strand:+ start:750 stop:1262 length:513 start_codon:yes stop_codon:yes gene_type:complete